MFFPFDLKSQRAEYQSSQWLYFGWNEQSYASKKQIIAKTEKKGGSTFQVFFFYYKCNKNAKFTLGIYSLEKK